MSPRVVLLTTTLLFTFLVLLLHTNQYQTATYTLISSTIPDLSPNITRTKYFLVFVIPCQPGKVDSRAAIREQWANLSRWGDQLSDIPEEYKKIKLNFMFASDHEPEPQFEEERKRHPDDMFMVDNLLEMRTALKYKVLWGMQQALFRYDFTYLIKTDDDIVVNLPLLIRELMEAPRERYYAGTCLQAFGGFNSYPSWRYCSGGGYVLSRDVIEQMQLLPKSVHGVQFRPEDAYTGYLVNRVSQLLHYPVKRRNLFKLGVYGYKCGPFHRWFYQVSRIRAHFTLVKKIIGNETATCYNSTGL